MCISSILKPFEERPISNCNYYPFLFNKFFYYSFFSTTFSQIAFSLVHPLLLDKDLVVSYLVLQDLFEIFFFQVAHLIILKLYGKPTSTV